MDNQKLKIMQIAICDDEPLILKKLEDQVKKVIEETGKPFRIYTFQAGQDLIKKIEMYHMVFLDIEMPGMDGIQTRQEIVKRNPECKIVITSDQMERFNEVLQIKAFRFIMKPFDIEEIREAVKSYESQITKLEEIKVFYNRNPFWISQPDILYIVTNDGAVEIVTENRVYRRDMPLRELKKILDSQNFFQVNRQYMVNLLWITVYEKGVIYMGEQKISVARRRKKEFERVYNDFNIT